VEFGGNCAELPFHYRIIAKMQEYSSRRDPKDYNFGLDNPKLPNLRIQGRIWGMFKLGRVSAAG